MNRNRILNRPLDPTQMEAALAIAADGATGTDGRERLEIRLRDAGIALEARKKVEETLHPVWINPPAETAAFIAWAVEESREVIDLRPVHLVALIATYPFFGDVMAAVGRQLRHEGAVDSMKVRERLKSRWGDRDSVAVATRKCLLTLRNFGMLTGERGSTASMAGLCFQMSGDWAMWAACALLLTRGSEQTDAATVESAPEFFFLDLHVPKGGNFPLLERMGSGDGRTTFAMRPESSSAAR